MTRGRKTAALALITLLLLPVRAYPHAGPSDLTPLDACCMVLSTPFDALGRLFREKATLTVNQRGVKLRVRRESLSRYYDRPGKPLREAVLVSALVYPVGTRRIRLAPGLVKFDPEGNLLECTPGETVLLPAGGQEIPVAPRPLRLYPDGSLRGGHLGRDTKIIVGGQALLLSAKAGPDVYLPDERNHHLSGTGFHPGGQLHWGRLAAPAELDTGKHRLKLSGRETLRFREDGRLSNIYPDPGRTLVLTFKTPGAETALALRSRINFHENGEVRSGNLAEAATWRLRGNVVHLPEGRDHYYPEIFFYDNGSLRKAFIAHAQPLKAGGRSYSFRDQIFFYRDGRLKGGVLEDKALVPVGRGGKRYSLLLSGLTEFYPDGKARRGTIIGRKDGTSGRILHPQIVFLNGRRTPVDWDWAEAYFYESGEVHSISTYHRGDEKNEYLLNGEKTRVSHREPVIFADFHRGVVEAVSAGNDSPYMDIAPLKGPCIGFKSKSRIAIPREIPFVWIKTGGRSATCPYIKVEALQFPDDVIIEVDGKKRSCRAFTWISLTE